jgi:mRNA interferase HigB
MQIFTRRTLREYWESPGREDSRIPLASWFRQTSAASWGSFAELRQDFANADYVGNERVVFNIGGNKHRLVAKVDFKYQMIFVRFIGTHAEYDKVKVSEI